MQLNTIYTTITEKLPNQSEAEVEIIIKQIADGLYKKLVGELEPEKQQSLQSLIDEGLTSTELIDYFTSMHHFSDLVQSVTDQVLQNHTQNPA